MKLYPTAEATVCEEHVEIYVRDLLIENQENTSTKFSMVTIRKVEKMEHISENRTYW